MLPADLECADNTRFGYHRGQAEFPHRGPVADEIKVFPADVSEAQNSIDRNRNCRMCAGRRRAPSCDQENLSPLRSLPNDGRHIVTNSHELDTVLTKPKA